MTLTLAPGVLYQESPKQRYATELALSGQYRYLLYGGGIRGGKTYWALAIIFLLCKLFPGSRAVIVRKDLPTLRRTIVPSFEKLRPRDFCGPINQGDWTAKCTNGSVIVFFTESISEDPDLNRWKSLEANWIFLEEANELQGRSFHKAQERAGSWVLPSGIQPHPLVLLTCNPSPGWIKRLFYDPWQRGELHAPYAFVPSLAAENPFNPDAYIAGLSDLPPQEYKRYVAGDWSVLTGQFFDALRETHFTDAVDLAKLPDWWTYWGGYDWGYRHNAVFTAMAKDGDGNALVLDTLYMHKMSDEAMGSLIGETFPERCRRLVYGGQDCFSFQQAHAQRGHSVKDVFAGHGVYLLPANVQRVQGWSALRRGLDNRPSDDPTEDPEPLIRLCDTPGNRRLFDDTCALVANDTNLKDTVKVDADENGQGGDDGPDAWRFAVVSGMQEYAKPHDSVDEPLPAENTAPGWDYQRHRKKPSRMQAALSQWQKQLRGGKSASIRVPSVGRTPGMRS